jgi:hypothetical protein
VNDRIGNQAKGVGSREKRAEGAIGSARLLREKRAEGAIGSARLLREKEI